MTYSRFDNSHKFPNHWKKIIFEISQVLLFSWRQICSSQRHHNFSAVNPFHSPHYGLYWKVYLFYSMQDLSKQEYIMLFSLQNCITTVFSKICLRNISVTSEISDTIFFIFKCLETNHNFSAVKPFQTHSHILQVVNKLSRKQQDLFKLRIRHVSGKEENYLISFWDVTNFFSPPQKDCIFQECIWKTSHRRLTDKVQSAHNVGFPLITEQQLKV